MISSLGRFFSVRYNYDNPVARQRAQGLLVMIWTAVLGIAIFISLQVIIALATTASLPAISPDLLLGLVLLVVSHLLIQRGRMDAATWLFVGILIVPLVLAVAISVDPGVQVALVLPLVAAGVLLSRRSFLLVTALFIVALIIRALNQSQSFSVLPYVPADNAVADLVSYGIFLGIGAIFLLVFSGSAERASDAATTDIERLKAVGNFRASLEGIEGESAILTRTLETVQNVLGFDLAQIYLLDEEGRFARHVRLGLGAAENPARRIPLREVDEAIFREALAVRQPILIVSGQGRERGDHLNPPARASLTVALVSAGVVLGVLDVQSEHRELFTENAITALDNLGSQTARELVQARRLNNLELSLRDQEGIINRFLNQITELQQRSQSTSAGTWGRYLQARGEAGFGFDYEGGIIVSSNDLPEQIRRAVQQGDIAIERVNGTQIVNVPITLRDQVLGALSFNIPADRLISERQVEMLRTIANRLGVALESNRLLEQTQAQAARERKASEISSTLLAATDVEAVLELAAENFNEALGAVHTRVYLEPGVLAHSGEAQ